MPWTSMVSCVGGAVSQLKAAGNTAFAAGDYYDAVHAYTAALEHASETTEAHAALLSNRSAAFERLQDYTQALRDADACAALRPGWDKAFFRQAMANVGLKQLAQAAQCCEEGLQQCPASKELLQLQALLAELRQGEERRNGPPASPSSGVSALDGALCMLKQAGVSRQLPVTVLSGFLGAGKTTLLQRILRNQQGLKVAVIVNDMAEVGIDAELVRTGGGQIRQAAPRVVELSNGCICCTLRDDLLQEVATLAAERRFDYLLIESTGISEPMPVAASFHTPASSGDSLSAYAAIDSMVTVVDGPALLRDLRSLDSLADRRLAASSADDRSIADLVMDQIEFANLLLLNKCDLLPQAEADKAEALLRKLNPAAGVRRTSFCNVDLAEVLHTRRFDLEQAAQTAGWQQELMGGASQHAPESEQYGVGSFVWRSQRPFHPQRLWARVLEQGALPPVLRSKGFFWVANRPELAWEWSTAGSSRRFTYYGRWLDSSGMEGPVQPAGQQQQTVRGSKAISGHAGLAEAGRQSHVGDRGVVHTGVESGQGSPLHANGRHETGLQGRWQRLVFIGIDLQQDAITSILDACLLTLEELEAGPATWEAWACPWDTLLT